jgi:hypothetical protein
MFLSLEPSVISDRFRGTNQRADSEFSILGDPFCTRNTWFSVSDVVPSRKASQSITIDCLDRNQQLTER